MWQKTLILKKKHPRILKGEDDYWDTAFEHLKLQNLNLDKMVWEDPKDTSEPIFKPSFEISKTDISIT